MIGYAIGKRRYYGSLLAAIKRKWTFKGALELLTLEKDFFLFKFSCKEDYDKVWDNGPCFLNGKSFLFQKWQCDFRPTKANFSEISLWIKLPNFPLCCWNPAGISKVASRVGIPLAVDSLTASKARLTFARVCVQVNTSSPLPDTIPINLNGLEFDQEVLYDWKPSFCNSCSSFSHDDNSYPKNAGNVIKPPNPRNRSRSRNRAVAQRPSSTSAPPPPPPDLPPLPPPPPPPPPIITEPVEQFDSNNVLVSDLNLVPTSSPSLDNNQFAPLLDEQIEEVSAIPPPSVRLTRSNTSLIIH